MKDDIKYIKDGKEVLREKDDGEMEILDVKFDVDATEDVIDKCKKGGKKKK